MERIKVLTVLLTGILIFLSDFCLRPSQAGRNFSPALASSEEGLLTVRSPAGRFGGTLIISQRSEPKTLNPLTAIDGNSRDIIGLISADLIHINRYTQRTEAALAASWTVSSDGRQYTLHLRRGVRFSDGHPFDANDVIFSFDAYLDERNHAPQRDLLIITGKPISVQKIDPYTVLFTLAQPYAAAERLFDSIAILPKHLLIKRFDEGKLASAWGLNTRPEEIAGLGPFRIKDYVPGQRLRLERNPYYWKKNYRGNRLPYLSGITSLFIPSADAEAMRFDAGEIDIVGRLNAPDFDALEIDQQSRGFRLYDLGPGLEYSFLVFNLNDFSDGLTTAQRWFQHLLFRRAISAAVDRDSIVHLAYHGRAYPLSSQISPGNKLWAESNVPNPVHSLRLARKLLYSAGFSWKENGSLSDPKGNPVEFSIMHNAAKPEQGQVAEIIQQDLRQLGIKVTLIPLEFRSLVDRVFTSFQYEAAILTLADGDSDPNSEMSVLTSKGTAHIWRLKQRGPPPQWQQEVDKLMDQQLTAPNYLTRKRIYDHVQDLIRENVPMVFLTSPHILVGAKDRVGNFHPAVLPSYTLWNAEELFIRQAHGGGS